MGLRVQTDCVSSHRLEGTEGSWFCSGLPAAQWVVACLPPLQRISRPCPTRESSLNFPDCRLGPLSGGSDKDTTAAVCTEDLLWSWQWQSCSVRPLQCRWGQMCYIWAQANCPLKAGQQGGRWDWPFVFRLRWSQESHVGRFLLGCPSPNGMQRSRSLRWRAGSPGLGLCRKRAW